jgi:hypothetical protein
MTRRFTACGVVTGVCSFFMLPRAAKRSGGGRAGGDACDSLSPRADRTRGEGWGEGALPLPEHLFFRSSLAASDRSHRSDSLHRPLTLASLDLSAHAGRGERASSFSRRFFCARGLRKPLHESRPEKIKGRRSADRRLVKEPRHTSRRCRLPMLRARRAPRSCDVAAAMRFGRARLSALHRGFPRAALGCTRFGPGRASRQREERALPDHRSRLSQAPGTPAVLPRGSIPGPPGSGVTSPARRNRNPLHQSAVNRLTSLRGASLSFFSWSRGANSRHSAGRRHASDLMRIFFALCLMCRDANCDTAAMIRCFSARLKKVRTFSNCGTILQHAQPGWSEAQSGSSLAIFPVTPDYASLHPGCPCYAQ